MHKDRERGDFEELWKEFDKAYDSKGHHSEGISAVVELVELKLGRAFEAGDKQGEQRAQETIEALMRARDAAFKAGKRAAFAEAVRICDAERTAAIARFITDEDGHEDESAEQIVNDTAATVAGALAMQIESLTKEPSK